MRVGVGSLTIETIRGMGARPLWTASAIIAAMAVGLACGWMVVADTQAINARAERLARQGWGLITVSSASGGSLDPRACSAVERVAGVQRVGAVGPTNEVVALGLQAGLGLTPVTSEVINIVWPNAAEDASSGRLTPGFVALSGTNGGFLTFADNGVSEAMLSTAVVGPGRYPALDGGVLVPTNELTEANYCIAEVSAIHAEQLALDIAASVASFGVVAVPAVSTDEASPTPQQMVEDHQSRYTPLLGAAFLGVIGALRLLRSRRDRAVYRLLSFGRADLWLMGLLDYAICLATPSLSAFAAAVLWAEGRGVSTAALGVGDLQLLASAGFIVAIGQACLWAAGRNRHQFAPGA